MYELLLANLPSWFKALDFGAWCIPALAATLYLLDGGESRSGLSAHFPVDISNLLESIPDMAIILDKRGRVVEANSAAIRTAGHLGDKLIGMPIQELTQRLQVTDGVSPVTFPSAVITRALAGEMVRNERRMLRQPDTGTTLEVVVSASPIRTRKGDIVGVLLIARDVTELSLLQRRVGDMERHHAIGQMAAALAHDFNNVLDTIGQAVTVLELSDEQPLAERKEVLGMIRNAVRRGAEIIAGVREYLRTGTGEKGPVDVRQVLIETIELTRPLWQRSKVRLTTRFQPVRPVRANAADLRRVFANLIINAIEAMPGGGELVISSFERNGRVVATVADTGTGIPPEHQNKIFFPYFTTKPQGTGLGLSGAQKIVLSQGGNISYRTEPGKGTEFTVELPVSESQQIPKTDAA